MFWPNGEISFRLIGGSAARLWRAPRGLNLNHMERNMDIEPSYITVSDVCAMTGLGETFARAAISKGELPAFKIGHSVRLRREAVIAWAEAKSAA